MIRIALAAVAAAFLFQAAPAAAGDKHAHDQKAAAPAKAEAHAYKVGDTVYTCACGAQCTCKPHVSATPGQCGCKKDMVQAKVVKVEKGSVTVKAEGQAEQVVPL